LYPSLYEGWGLPIVEALQHGRPVIASNRGAVPEASLGFAEIIDPDDRQAWRKAISTEAHSPRRHIIAQDIPRWDQTANAVKVHLSRLLKSVEVAV
jgi:glycosyltransferase involved in cell wall biosynthesis